jgi:large subunit ribosomal protein L21e
MVKTSKGLKSRTRKKLKRGLRHKFKPSIFLQEFKSGDKVVINAEPSSQSSIPHTRTRGKIGEIVSRRGSSYIIKVKIGNSTKQVITKPEHIKIHGG